MFLALKLEDVLDFINNALRGLWAVLCEFIYPAIAWAYQLFEDISLVTYTDKFSQIYNKISLIIGIFMVFRVTFWLIEMLVNPDTITDKEKNPGKIIQKVLITVVLLAITPTIFGYAFKIQHYILVNDTIEKIISPGNTTINVGNSGRKLAADLFINFYTSAVNESGQIDVECNDYTGVNGRLHSDLIDYGKLNNLTGSCLTKRFNNNQRNSSFVIDFNGIFAVGVGIVVFWMILMYCISAGARYIQLLFLQIIAPIPIMCYLTPAKENMFSKWLKQCTTTYLDLFIRIVIISFVVLLCNIVLNNDGGILDVVSEQGRSLVQIFLVLGLLTFAKKAPDLIQELLPKSFTSKASGDFGLSLKKRTDNMFGGKFMYNTLKRAPGYAAGGIAGGLVGMGLGIAGGKGFGSKLMGGISGATKGFATGSKKGNMFKNVGEAWKNQSKYNDKLKQWRISAGKGENDPNTWSDYWERRSAGFAKNVGFLDTPAQKIENRIKEYDKQLTNLNARSSVYGEVSGSVGKMEDRATSQLDTKTFGADKIYQRDLQARRRNFKALNQAMSNGDGTTALTMANSEYDRANKKLMELKAAGKKAGDKEYDEANADLEKIVEIRDSIVNKTYDAAQAEGDMTDVLTETRNRFITYSLQDKNGDAVIKNEAHHISEVVNHEDNKDAFEGFKNDANGSSYDEFDKLSSEAKTANTQLTNEIYATKTAKEALANSEEKQKADAADKFNSGN